ncbi:hypothetical protein [Stenotrophomonas sp.]|uniref:hypothetical protein n=1 Tax=Stenotrophomonas sp. TaxID=69392 RepID=UPI002898A7F3|nr:hypothetical protein [Stenotrophomonas sp.]
MSAPVDVLAEMERASVRLFDAGLHGGLRIEEAIAAVAELFAKADAALVVLGEYAEKIEGEWGVCLTLDQMLANGHEPEYAGLRDALARVKGGAQ